MLLGYTEKEGRYLKMRGQSPDVPTYAAALALCKADGGQFPMYKTQADFDLVRSFTHREHWLGKLLLAGLVSFAVELPTKCLKALELFCLLRTGLIFSLIFSFLWP